MGWLGMMLAHRLRLRLQGFHSVVSRFSDSLHSPVDQPTYSHVTRTHSDASVRGAVYLGQPLGQGPCLPAHPATGVSAQRHQLGVLAGSGFGARGLPFWATTENGWWSEDSQAWWL